jgi:hypothetical protein
MKKIDISTGAHPHAELLVDDEDYPWIAKLKWTPIDNGCGNIYAISGRKTRIYLHREVMRSRFYEKVDHRDGNGLNNQKSNLRIATAAQNAWNAPHGRGNSKFKGVFRYRGRKYRAYISANNKQYHLGYFESEIEAAKAHDRKALELHGEFARVNFPDEVDHGRT